MIHPVTEPEFYFWSLHHLDATRRHIHVRVRLPAHAHRAATERTLDWAIGRHPILRSSFPIIGGTVMRKEAPLRSSAQEAAAHTRGAHFRIREAPPWRWWIDDSAEAPELVLELHHILVDAAAINALRKDLLAQFDEARTGETNPFPAAALDLPPTDTAVRDRSSAYWVELLGQCRPLGFAHRRPVPATALRGTQIEFWLGAPDSLELTRAARSANTTAAMQLMAYYVVLLQRLSLSDEVLLTYAFANRSPRQRNLVRNLALPLFLRLSLEDDPLVGDVVRSVRDAMLQGAANRDFSVARVWDGLTAKSLQAGTFTHWHLFAGRNYFSFTDRAEVAQKWAEPRATVTPALPVSTYLDLKQGPDGISGSFGVNNDIFGPAGAHTFVDALLELCRHPFASFSLHASQAVPCFESPAHESSDQEQEIRVRGTPVRLSELEELGHQALTGESDYELRVVASHDGTGVRFFIRTNSGDPGILVRFQRNLATCLLSRWHIGLAGTAVLLEKGTDVPLATAALGRPPAADREAEEETERFVCGLLSEVAGTNIRPDDVYLAAGGSFADLPQIVSLLAESGVAAPPLLPLFLSAPISTYVRTLRRSLEYQRRRTDASE